MGLFDSVNQFFGDVAGKVTGIPGLAREIEDAKRKRREKVAAAITTEQTARQALESGGAQPTPSTPMAPPPPQAPGATSATSAMRKKRKRGPLSPGQAGGSTSGTALNAQGSSLFTGNIGSTTQNSLFAA